MRNQSEDGVVVLLVERGVTFSLATTRRAFVDVGDLRANKHRADRLS